MGRGNTFMLMVTYIQVNTRMIKNMGKELFHGITGTNMWGTIITGI